MDYSCKGQYGNGLYSKLWQFIPGEFYDRAEAFVYETSEGLRWIDAAQAMTPNYVTWGGWTLRQNYLAHINNSMKLHRQQCIYSLEADAQPGVVSVAITDAIICKRLMCIITVVFAMDTIRLKRISKCRRWFGLISGSGTIETSN